MTVTVTPLATITPCPAAPPKVAHTPITVTSQYQAVSTCDTTVSCIKRRWRTHFVYDTYSFVSTVIPCPPVKPPFTTITKTEQSVLVSRSSSTITKRQITSKIFSHSGSSTTSTATQTTYTTVVKEWSAEYKDLGPLALPDYKGSGLCTSCKRPHGELQQVVDAIECANSEYGPTVCSKGTETWIYNPNPTSIKKVWGHCSSHAVASSAGVYTFAFTQWAPSTVIPVPARTITYTIGGHRPSIVTTTVTETVTTIPRHPWTAYITRSCARPTRFDIDVTITKTITYTVPPFVIPCPT